MGAPPASVSRRSLIAGTAGLAALSLVGCTGGRGEATELRFYQTKREVIPYVGGLLQDFREEFPGIRPIHDTSEGTLNGMFVRSSPPDLALQLYNYEMARFVGRGELSDLSDLPETQAIADPVMEQVEIYPQYEGRTSVLPYSMMAASVIYNKEIFDEHGVEVPTTYSEFIDACETFEAADVTPVYGTYGDAWTVKQGLVDYAVGGMVDVIDFFEQLRAQGPDVGPDSPVSFSKVLREPLEKMLEIAQYTQGDARGRNYGDGNNAFASGEAAMYFQGPWALIEVGQINPDLAVGTFPLPMTEDPADNKVRVNLDLALWIPEGSRNQEEARELLQFLARPEIQDAYNDHALGFGVRTDAPDVTDERIAEMQPYVDRGAIYQGVSQGIPLTIPFESYCQDLVFGADLENMLSTLDADWARLAKRS
ncbi:ABC transporter substrate-binding protein [Nesterenkonia xinjiangensis]|uniref:Raffinose/stachyose/melibiose transport system substrate-binding protein n=1 Tax=Nesterenkonia xinjiangensis TaxID=225327 RepID=A0A7Z0K9V2_9MICC|nr:extracellular solute-binding protein [Nesterenkonia xinjiangensis]NYJ78138.1 raffinose/stachyose/melibiose transport system substrate-binding protein [Nesterenkonia xinjiangensis]